MRGRNNNNNNNNGGNRRGPNPLTRSYESNGPDVKIRGTAQHIGEKYLQLARDAQTSGDPVAAESYLQHAEHYFRIIAAAHQAQQQTQAGYVRQPGDTEPEENDGDEDVVMPDRFSLPSERFAAPPPAATPAPVGTGQQPYADRAGFNGERVNGQDRYERQDRGDNGYRAERQDRGDQRPDRDNRPDRDQRQDRPNAERPNYERNPADRSGYDRDKAQRNDRPDRNMQRGSRYSRDGQDYREPRNDREPQAGRDQREGRDPSYREQPRIQHEPVQEARPVTPEPDVGPDLPAFITAPVRPTPIPDVAAAAEVQPAAPSHQAHPVEAEVVPDGFAVRPRRRRRVRAVAETEAGVEPSGDAPSE